MQYYDSVVIYHANCSDGIAAALAIRCAKISGITAYKPMNYGEPIDYASIGPDTVVHIVDFSFPREVLLELATRCKYVYLSDHHKTAAEDLIGDWGDLAKPVNLAITFDMERSGAVLAWNIYNPHKPLPIFFSYVQDRDLWKHKLAHTREINAIIQRAPKTLDAYEELMNAFEQEIDKFVDLGGAILNAHDEIVQDIVKLARPCVIHDNNVTGETYDGLVANCTGHFASDVGNELAKLSGSFGATYFQGSDGSVKWSLRSIGDYDVSTIAKAFGGGGHRNAAGFILSAPEQAFDNRVTLWANLSTEPSDPA